MQIHGLNQTKQYTGMTQNLDSANNSGQGKGIPVPDSVSKRFNWGAFGLSWIWGLFNKTYITLTVFLLPLAYCIPILGNSPYNKFFISLAVGILFGRNGNSWAWQNKKWQSIEHFHSVQKKWAIASWVWIILNTLLTLLVLTLYNYYK